MHYHVKFDFIIVFCKVIYIYVCMEYNLDWRLLYAL